MKVKGLLPGEYRKIGLVEVKNENKLAGRITVDGQIEINVELYVLSVRRLESKWAIDVSRTMPLDDGRIPDEVIRRINTYQDSIMKEQCRDRGKEQAMIRSIEDDSDTAG